MDSQQLTQRTVLNQGSRNIATEQYCDQEEPEAEMNEKWQTTRIVPSTATAQDTNPVEKQPQSEPELSFQPNGEMNEQE